MDILSAVPDLTEVARHTQGTLFRDEQRRRLTRPESRFGWLVGLVGWLVWLGSDTRSPPRGSAVRARSTGGVVWINNGSSGSTARLYSEHGILSKISSFSRSH
jgi:hypothetical protein